MLKRICLLLLCALCPPAFAGMVYVGANFAYEGLYLDNLRFQALSPRLTAGYSAWPNDWFYLAGEVFGSPKDYAIKYNQKVGPTLRTKYTLGVSILPGIYLDNTMIGYLRLGANFAKFSQVNGFRRGWQTGIGLETLLTAGWSVRGEYTFVRYASMKGVGSPRADEFAIAFLYSFYPCYD